MEPRADFVDEIKRIVASAHETGLVIRAMGAAAVKLHCPEYAYLYNALERKLSDLDFVAYSKDLEKVEELFERLDYKTRKLGYAISVGAYGERSIFEDAINNRIADVFYDRLKMSHTIEYKGRLELDYPTVPLADILLQKMQIVNLNEKDLKDTIVLLREHEVGETEKETVNAGHIVELLRDDWGFYYTVTTNLKRTEECLGQFNQLSDQDRKDVADKIVRLLDAIEKSPKTLRWKMRAKIGTSKKWYDDVEETIRTY
jgi:hypothetical protein